MSNDYSSPAPTQEEMDTLTCAWCGQIAKDVKGLKRHKTVEYSSIMESPQKVKKRQKKWKPEYQPLQPL